MNIRTESKLLDLVQQVSESALTDDEGLCLKVKMETSDLVTFCYLRS